jgi:hypothetical protein
MLPIAPMIGHKEENDREIILSYTFLDTVTTDDIITTSILVIKQTRDDSGRHSRIQYTSMESSKYNNKKKV